MLYLKFKDGVVEQPIVSEVNIPRWSPTDGKPLGIYGLENYQRVVNLDGNGYFEYAAPSGFLKYLLVDEHLEDNDSTVDVNMGPGLDDYATFQLDVPGNIETDPQFAIPPTEIYFSGHDSNPEWFGTVGMFKIEFSVQRTGISYHPVEVLARLSSAIPCYRLNTLPDSRRNIVRSNAIVYEPMVDITFSADYFVDISSAASEVG